MKTLEESAKELKESIDRFHKARTNFLNAYSKTLENGRPERYSGDAYFQSKFGERVTRWDHTQE